MRRTRLRPLANVAVVAITLIAQAAPALASGRVVRHATELAASMSAAETLAVPSVRTGAQLAAIQRTRPPAAFRTTPAYAAQRSSVSASRLPIPRARSRAVRDRIRTARDDPPPH